MLLKFGCIFHACKNFINPTGDPMTSPIWFSVPDLCHSFLQLVFAFGGFLFLHSKDFHFFCSDEILSCMASVYCFDQHDENPPSSTSCHFGHSIILVEELLWLISTWLCATCNLAVLILIPYDMGSIFHLLNFLIERWITSTFNPGRGCCLYSAHNVSITNCCCFSWLICPMSSW